MKKEREDCRVSLQTYVDTVGNNRRTRRSQSCMSRKESQDGGGSCMEEWRRATTSLEEVSKCGTDLKVWRKRRVGRKMDKLYEKTEEYEGIRRKHQVRQMCIR